MNFVIINRFFINVDVDRSHLVNKFFTRKLQYSKSITIYNVWWDKLKRTKISLSSKQIW